MTTKDFKNPLANYITQDIPTIENTQEATTQKNNENQAEKMEFDYAKDKKEIKSKRVQLVITPSMHKALKQRAKAEKASVNDFICQLLEKVL